MKIDLTKDGLEAEEMGRDGHTHSWLTYKEIMDYDWLQDIGDGCLYDSVHIFFKSLINEMRYLASHYGEERVRMVFWFDN